MAKYKKGFFYNPCMIRKYMSDVLEDYSSIENKETKLILECIPFKSGLVEYHNIDTVADNDVEPLIAKISIGDYSRCSSVAILLCREMHYYQSAPWYANCPCVAEYDRIAIKKEITPNQKTRAMKYLSDYAGKHSLPFDYDRENQVFNIGKWRILPLDEFELYEGHQFVGNYKCLRELLEDMH